MKENIFNKRLHLLTDEYRDLIEKPNEIIEPGNGIVSRYKNPVLTAAHTPLLWRFDLNEQSNPYLMERFGINAVMNAGAIYWENKYLLMVRVESVNRKSFFAIAESPNGIDQFTFWDYPVDIPALGDEVNLYDMRLVQHEDGWIYGIFCTESRDPAAKEDDQSAAIAQCGIARTKNLKEWERLPNLKTSSPQQRNVVLHPEFVDDQYAFYTRPQDGFIEAGKGGGIAFGLCKDILNPEVNNEEIIDPKKYHTVYELKNGQGPAPIKTDKGWIHLAHGVRNTAAGLRYVLYMFMTSLDDVARIIYKPSGYILAPVSEERTGDVSNVLFSNGWIENPDGTIFIYYASSDTRMHVATSSVEKLLDYLVNSPEEVFNTDDTVKTLTRIIEKNKSSIESPLVETR